jgi:hypothetical protein
MHPLFSSNFNKNFILWTDFPKIIKFYQNPFSSSQVFHEEGQTDIHGEADIRFRSFAELPKILISIILLLLLNI